MKKLLSLLMLLIFAGVGNVWAQGSFSLVQDNNIAFTPGTADNTSVENLTFTIGANETWTTQSRTYNSYTKSAKKGTVSLTNNVPTAGTFLVFTPNKNGKISVDIYWGTQNKAINVYDATNPSVSIASQSVGSTKEAQTFTFDVEANKTYYVYAAGTGALEIFGFTYTPDSEGANAVMIAVEDMRYAAQKTGTALNRTIRDFDFTYSGDIRSYESGGNYTLFVKDNGSITIKSKDENIKIQQVALYSTDVSEGNRGDFIYEESPIDDNVTVKYLHYTNVTGTNSVTFTNGTSQNFNIYNIWIQTDNAISRTKQDVTLSYSPSVGNATVGTNDFSIGELATTPSSFRVDNTYTVTDDGGTGTTFNTYHGTTNQASVNVGSKNGVATIQATFAGNDYFNAATPAEYKLVVTGEAKTKWDFTVSEDIDKSNLQTDNTNWTYNDTYKYYDNNGHEPSGTALTANSVPLLYADGLTFSGNIQIFPDNCIRLTNDGRTITIPNVAANKYVAVTFRSTNTTESRGFTASGTSGATGTFNTVAQKTVYVHTTSTGSFVLTSNSGMEVLGLEIVDEIPHEAMFTMTTPATTTDVSTSTDIVLTADRDVEVISGGNTVNLTVNGTTVAFTFDSTNNTLTCSNATLTAKIGTLADETSYTIALPADVIQVEDGAQNSAQNFAFVTAAPAAALTPEYNRTWTFDEFETTTFASAVLENNMELVGKTGSDMAITTSNKTYEGVKYTHRLQTKGTGTSDARYIHIKVAAGSKIAVWGVSSNSSETRTVKIMTGSFNGTQVASGTFGTDITTVQTESSIAAESDVYIYADGAMNIYGVKVWSDKTPLTRFSPKGNQYSELNKDGRTEWPKYYIYYTPTEANIQVSELSISSSDASILDVSQVTYDLSTAGQIGISKMKMGEGGTATITLNYTGNTTYAATSTDFTLTVIAPGQFRVQVDDQQIQRGQRSVVTPVITDKNGNPIGIRGTEGNYSTYVLDEDDDTPDYSTYFDFAYSEGEGTGTNYTQIKVDASGNITTRTGDTYAEVGATRTINVTATVKSDYASLFTNNSISSSGTMTIVEAAQQLEVNFFFDAACTDAHKIVIGTDNRVDGSTGVFGDSGTFPDGFPNGRMIYVKPTNEGDEVWFSFAKNADAATLTSDHKIDKNKRIFQYRRGIPIYINETIEDGDYISVNAVAMYKNESGKWQLRGGIAKMKFLMTDFTRPAQPTYDPVSPDKDSSKNNEDRKIMNTSENVVAYGEGASKTTIGNGNLVYGKFSTSSVYKLEQLINEQTVSYGINSVPVVSTEVNKRRFTAVQIKTIANDANYGYGEYISDTTYTEYFYLYDTRLALTPAGNQYINVNASTTPPTTSVKWYNKVAPGWQDVNTKTVTFSISSRNDAEGATIDSSTGVVTAGGNAGWVRVKASYAGSYPSGETHGGSDADGEPQYKSYLAPSEAYFYVYISDPKKEEPMITPPSRKFTSTQSFKIQAPTNWDVRYTTNGTEPTATTGTYLKHGTSVEGVVTGTTTVKAIAYNPDATANTSRVVSETYTKVDPLPDPVFDPNGVPSPWYYNTNSLTVQIACAYAGSVIYYTVDGSIPEIDAEGTYKYSGLEKVVIAGNVAIKAIAYDPVADIYSNVVTSNYIYSSEMQKPYFQISDDGGTTWKGLATEGATTLTENGTKWYGGEAMTVTPSTQIRIVDPNPVKGNVFFTLDGSVPSANTSLIYRTPFTTPKTVTGKAITFLDEASSPVASAEFVIDRSRYPVWEATYETLTNESGVYGMRKDDGYIISTDKDLKTSNSMTKVNTHSISTDNGGTATRTYAQQDITATFGGYDLQDWTQMSIADDAIGNPLGNVGDFTIKSVDNAKDELKNNCNHAYFFRTDGKTANTTPTLHEKTFRVPANGTFVRFEPERDGDLTIWVLQQGAVHYEDDKYLIPNYIRLKPVYLVDEQGNSIQVKKVNGVDQMWSSARLSANWTKLRTTAAENGGDGGWKDYNTDGTGETQYLCLTSASGYPEGTLLGTKPTSGEKDKDWKEMVNKGPNRTESKYIFERFENYLTTNHINIGDNIEPIAIHVGNEIKLNNEMYVDNSNDGTGYVLASGGYAKYTFPVKAGKTYFFMGVNTKIGIRGFQFVADTTEPSNTLTITESGESNSTAIAAAVDAGTTYKTTGFDRVLTPNTWTTLVLPFSISATQLEQILGEGTDIMHFDRVDGTRLYFYGHWHRMIVAGTPVFIKPTNTDKLIDLNNLYVQVENEVPETFTSSNYTFQGYYDYGQHLNQYDYYISKAGNFCHWTNAATNLKSTRAVLHNGNGASGAKLTLFMEALDEIGETTGIEAIYDTETGETTVVKDATIYNVSGQVVRSHANTLDGLPKGIYIVNGKKYVVE